MQSMVHYRATSAVRTKHRKSEFTNITRIKALVGCNSV